MMAEELRLLYVAVTRAKDKLILSVALTGGDGTSPASRPTRAVPWSPRPWPPVSRWDSGCCCLSWPGPRRPLSGTRERWKSPPTLATLGPAWDIRWIPGGALKRPPVSAQTEERTVRTVRPTGMGEGELRKALTWRYPWARDVEIPSKLTVTQLKGRELDREAAEHTPQAGTRRGEGVLRRPRFAEEEFGLTPAQKGVALHLVMQYIDFSKASSEAQAAREVERLVREEYLTPEQGKAVDPARLAAFFASPLGRRAPPPPSAGSSSFPSWSPARDYWPEAGEGEEVLLQGVVDCFFETAEGITVVDFKTDRVAGEALRRRAEEYRPQLEAYSRALEEITGRPVCRRVLWFFSENRGVEML